MNRKTNAWCAVPECMSIRDNVKRHFFIFPKERDRWLQWIHACKRLDLELKGPDYAHRNIRMCHLHFEKKWYTKKNRVRLHPDAIPTIFFGAAFAKNTEEDIHKIKIDNNLKTEQEETDRNVQFSKASVDMEIDAKSSTFSGTQLPTENLENSQQRKLQIEILKLKAQNKILLDIVRRLHEKYKKQSTISDDEANDFEKLCNLGLNVGRAKIYMVQTGRRDGEKITFSIV
ncbi:52 kDa repressor of the inhibitor of the protein kinase-like isoform X2 [Linepithema humile]|uniref:52 kDa repressor of the inhibitor of the protein kinase-like isoform X2 n=1 Tax=Linepithema humile TaxID=83485 RepID=UPI0006233BF9|nr:PREDICTED: 52 kDa repressor of the inhibitor of the protein kinase-like isoform X2 [Linepithema humile]